MVVELLMEVVVLDNVVVVEIVIDVVVEETVVVVEIDVVVLDSVVVVELAVVEDSEVVVCVIEVAVVVLVIEVVVVEGASFVQSLSGHTSSKQMIGAGSMPLFTFCCTWHDWVDDGQLSILCSQNLP